MHDPTYAFIDGGHLRTNYDDSISKWCRQPGQIDFSMVKALTRAQKCFYYDCLDDVRRDTDDDISFQSRIAAQELVFDQIQAIEGTHVRLGSMTGTAKNRRQKKVDILLAVDMLNHAERGNMKTAVLLTGDQDFVPVVQSLVNMGIYVRIMGDRKHTSRELIRAADAYFPIGIANHVAWSTRLLKERFPVPVTGSKLERINLGDVQIVKKGTKKGTPVTMYFSNGKHVVVFNDNDRLISVEHEDQDRLTLFCVLEFETIEWE
jgi:uncharacterized LabA/DUF88 family protein